MSTWIESESPTAAWVRELRERLQERERAKAESRASRAARLDSGSKGPSRTGDGRLRRVYPRGSERQPWAGPAVPVRGGIGTPGSSPTGTAPVTTARTPGGKQGDMLTRGAWKVSGRFPVRATGR